MYTECQVSDWIPLLFAMTLGNGSGTSRFWSVIMYSNGTLPLDAMLDARCVYTLTFYHPQQSCSKVMILQTCVKNSVHRGEGGHAWGRGTCMVKGVHGRGHVWWGACMAWGCVAGECMAGGMHGGGHAWHGVVWLGGMHCRGYVWHGACVAAGLHGMHTLTGYYKIQLVNVWVVLILLECILVEGSISVQSMDKVLYGATPCKQIH